MSLHSNPISKIPAETVRVAHAAFNGRGMQSERG